MSIGQQLEWERESLYIQDWIKHGIRPYPRKILEKSGDWKWLPFARHVASHALVHPPMGYSTNKILRWLKYDPHENPLLPSEIPPILVNSFVLPYPKREYLVRYVRPRIPMPDGSEIATGGVELENPDHLRWYEPSIYFMRTRINYELKKPYRTVGVTSGKFRLITVAHMNSLFFIRRNVDFMVVCIDPESHDRARIKDGFVPSYFEKVATLRDITFPDGRKIDLITNTHPFDPTLWYKQLYIPYVLSEKYSYEKASDVKAFLSIFKDAANFALDRSRASMDSPSLDMVSRLRYYVSHVDPFKEEKRLMAAQEGIALHEIPFPNWHRRVHVTKLAKKFNLESLEKNHGETKS